MAKRWKKQKAGRQQSRRRKKPVTQGGGGSETSSGGTMSGFRRGLQALVGSKKGPKSTLEKMFDAVLWIAVAAAAAFFVAKRCT